MRTQVGIVGAGPAGLMLSHLLHQRGIESVVIDLKTREGIEETIKAGVLEQGTVDLMCQTGVGDRMRRDGFVHHGINLAFSGAIHRVDLFELSGGRTVTVYPQHEVLKDLIARRLADGGDVRFGVSETTVAGLDGDRPTVSFLDGGQRQQLECDFVAAATDHKPTPGSSSPRARSAPTFSASTPSPGSASWPKRRPARTS
jgi:p-hydroxybenzoate 3-monooxygenase